MQSDYEMNDVLELTRPEQLKALGDPFRQKILALLLEQAATVAQLAKVLESPPSTIAHHLNLLTEAGLTKVVKTRQVRAITERYYGRVAQTYLSISHVADYEDAIGTQELSQLIQESKTSRQKERFVSYTSAFSRIPLSQAKTFAKRIDLLAQEFEEMSIPGEQAYNFLAIISQSDVPVFSKDEAE